MGGKNQESSSLCRTTVISGGTVNKDHLPEAGAQKSQVPSLAYEPKQDIFSSPFLIISTPLKNIFPSPSPPLLEQIRI